MLFVQLKCLKTFTFFQLMNYTIHCLSMNKKFKSETEAEEEKGEMKFIILKKKWVMIKNQPSDRGR